MTKPNPPSKKPNLGQAMKNFVVAAEKFMVASNQILMTIKSQRETLPLKRKGDSFRTDKT